MKIIGTTTSGFLIEASRDEIANLTGYYWHGSSNCPSVVIGSTIKISDMYKQLADLADSQNKADQIAKVLREMADNLRQINPLYKE